MSKLKGECPLCEEEIKEGEKKYRFRFAGQYYWVHDKCAHPKNEQLERIEKMLKWIIVDRYNQMMMGKDIVVPYSLPDIADILKKS